MVDKEAVFTLIRDEPFLLAGQRGLTALVPFYVIESNPFQVNTLIGLKKRAPIFMNPFFL